MVHTFHCINLQSMVDLLEPKFLRKCSKRASHTMTDIVGNISQLTGLKIEHPYIGSCTLNIKFKIFLPFTYWFKNNIPFRGLTIHNS